MGRAPTILTALLLFLAWESVSASSVPEEFILLEPAKQELTVFPGGETIRPLTLSNQTNKNVRFRTEIQDFVASEDAAEGIKLLGENLGPYSLKNYLSVAGNFRQFTLAPGQKVVIPVYLKLPNDVSPGSLHGGVFFAAEPEVEEADIAITSRLGVLFFVRVQGPTRTAGRLQEFGLVSHRTFLPKSSLDFQLLFENRGDRYLNPYGFIAVYDWRGREVFFQALEPWFVLPHSLRLYRISLEHKPWPGRYRALLKLNRGYEDLIDEQQAAFWVLPLWPWGLAFLSLLVIGGMILSRARMKIMVLILALIWLIAIPGKAEAHVASSTNYRLEFDSISVAGTTSTSTSYEVSDTLGEIATDVSSSTNYSIKAGYQQMVASYIALSTSASSLSLSPDISETGQTNGNVAITVLSGGGYSLAVKASTNPALKWRTGPLGGSGSTSFSNYPGAPDFTWSVSAASSAFGFSPSGDDIAAAYKNNGTICGAGVLTNAHCWDGFLTTDQTIATASSGPKNTVTTLNLRAEVGSSFSQKTGSYRASLTLTLVSL